jgi:Skp family chaperone for outer membrane proteins
MKLSRVVLISAIAFLFLAAGDVFAESQGKIGYIDLSRAFDEYQKTKDFDKELEARYKKDERRAGAYE